MLTKVEARNLQGDLFTMQLDDDSSGIIVKDIDGLDPVKATIVSSSFAQVDGTQFNSARREQRNIMIKMDLDPDYIDTEVSDLRDILYDFFMPKASVELRFYTSKGLVVNTSGRVESLEAPLFAKEPEANLSILCFDPDFIELTPEVLSGATVATSVETLITYEGTVETGVKLVLNVNRTIAGFSIYLRGPDGSTRQMDFTASLIAGDVLTIDTISGEKAATLVRAGVTSSLLYGISPQSPWVELTKGNNYLRVYVTGAAIPYTLTYTTRYGGL